MTKKTIFIISIVLIVLILIIVFSSKDSSNDPADNSTETVEQQLTDAVHTRDGLNFTGRIKYPKHPESKISEATVAFADNLIDSFAQEVASSESSSNDIFASYKTYSFDDILSIVFTVEKTYGGDTKDTSYETLVFNDKNVATIDNLLTGEYAGTLSSNLRSTLKQRFPTADSEAINALTEPVIANFEVFRVASNGIVFIYNTRDLGLDTDSSHEVLVSNQVLKNFMKY